MRGIIDYVRVLAAALLAGASIAAMLANEWTIAIPLGFAALWAGEPLYRDII